MKVIFIILLMGALTIGGIYAHMIYVKKVPLMNDISTNLEKIPQFKSSVHNQQLGLRPYNDLFRDLQKAGYPDIQPKYYNGHRIELLFQALEKTAAQMKNWKVVHIEPETFHMEIESKTSFFRFVDDVVLELRRISDTQTELVIRSRSRLGRFDFMMNAERIRQFIQKYDITLSKIIALESAGT